MIVEIFSFSSQAGGSLGKSPICVQPKEKGCIRVSDNPGLFSFIITVFSNTAQYFYNLLLSLLRWGRNSQPFDPITTRQELFLKMYLIQADLTGNYSFNDTRLAHYCFVEFSTTLQCILSLVPFIL